jgi:general secretion pathway protein E/type IV pilus assembly protein PilB
MLHGEGIVMRVLDKNAMKFSLRGIGMDEDIYAKFHQLIQLPHGIILVTGPTGSGKTTTLYSALSEIKDEETKIITTEDPIEYQLDGINQIQVHQKVGLTFAACLRAILRRPRRGARRRNRDFETTENATGVAHQPWSSTLHAATRPISRLSDMGSNRFLWRAPSKESWRSGWCALCRECRTPYEPPR